MLEKDSYFVIQFPACWTTFHSSSINVHTFALELQYVFFLTFTITRPFFALANLNAFQVFLIHFFFKIFFNLFALILASFQFLSISGTDLRQSVALMIETSITISIAFTKKITFHLALKLSLKT